MKMKKLNMAPTTAENAACTFLTINSDPEMLPSQAARRARFLGDRWFTSGRNDYAGGAISLYRLPKRKD
jgi:hypothetical protein